MIATKYRLIPRDSRPVTREDCPGAIAHLSEYHAVAGFTFYLAAGYHSDRQRNYAFNYQFKTAEKRSDGSAQLGTGR
jgi:hypothetical protein